MIRRSAIAVLVTLILSVNLVAQDPTVTATLTSTTCPGSGCVSLSSLMNRELASVVVSGTWTGPLVVEISSAWEQVDVYAAGSRTPSSTITTNGVYLVPMGGTSSIRVRATSITGSAVVRLTAGQGAATFELPNDAATASAQATANASLSSIDAKVVAVNTGAVTVASSALPTGASTSANQATGNASLSSIDAKITAVNTGAVVVSSSALPTGASTSALQTSGNTTLTSIDTKTPSLVSGRVPVDGSGVTQPVSGTVTANAGIGTFTIAPKNVISTVNSTSTTMVFGTTFTGTWEDVSIYGGVSVTLNRYQAGNDEQINLEWSTNGTDVDLRMSSTAHHADGQSASRGWSWQSPIKARYFRVRYLAGGTGPTDEVWTRLQTMYSTNAIQESLSQFAYDGIPDRVTMVGGKLGGAYGWDYVAPLELDSNKRLKVNASLDPITTTTTVGQAQGGTGYAQLVAGRTDADIAFAIPLVSGSHVPAITERAVTVSVRDASSLPLPTGASTLSEQQTQTTALQVIDNIVAGSGANVSQFGGTNVVTGTGTGGAGIPRVTVSSDSSITANAGTNLNTSALALAATQTDGSQKTQVLAGATAITATGNSLNVNCTGGCAAGSPGQQTMANSSPVVIASDQSAVSVSAASLPLPSGASTLAEQQTQTTALQTLDNIVSGAGVNVSQFGGSNVVTGTGASGSGIPRVTVSNDSSVKAATLAASGSITAAAQAVTLASTGYETVGVQVTGTWSGTLTAEYTVDGSTWVAGYIAPQTSSSSSSCCFGAIFTNGYYQMPASATAQIRLRASAWTSGTAVVTMLGSTSAMQAVQGYANLPITVNCLTVNNQCFQGTSDNGSTFPAFGFFGITGAVFNDSLTAVTSGNSGAFRMTTNRGLHVNLRSASGTEVAIKAASTAAAAADPSLVVALSPNSPVAAPVTAPVFVRLSDGASPITTLPVSLAGANDVDVLSMPANISVNHAQTAGVATAVNLGAADAGTQRTTLASEFTYAASTNLMTATAAGTGVFANLCGSATKTVRVQRIRVSGTVATGAKYGDVVIKKTTGATTGGTSSSPTAVAYDTGNGVGATATMKYYTVLGTAGTSATAIESAIMFLPITATPAATGTPLEFVWRDNDSEAPTLRGTAQCIELNFGTTTATAPTLVVSMKWTEK